MKNITIAIDDEVYRSARILAAQRGTSISALVREHLQNLAHHGARQQKEIKERNRLMEALLRKTAHFRVGPKPTRDEMNER